MSLLWNLGSRNVFRRCHNKIPSPFTTKNEFSRMVSSMSSSSSSSIIQSSASPLSSYSLSPYHLLSQLRFKGGVKTNSGCKKRFRVRGSGSIKRGKSGMSHNTGYKTRQRCNRLGSSTGITGKKIEQRVRKLLGVF